GGGQSTGARVPRRLGGGRGCAGAVSGGGRGAVAAGRCGRTAHGVHTVQQHAVAVGRGTAVGAAGGGVRLVRRERNALRVRAGRGYAVPLVGSQVHCHAYLLRTAGGRGVRIGHAPPRDEGRDGQRR